MKIIQKGFNYSQDGPGNRLVYHLQGCNMRCPWCANPEGIAINGTQMQVEDTSVSKSGIRIKSSYSEMSVDEIVSEVKRSRMMFFEGGGVTFTGGEPTVQFQELKELIQKLKAEEVHIAMENNGTCAKLSELFPMIDYLIMDFKHPNDVIHKEVTGVTNTQIIKNLETILESGRQLAMRIPLIHGFNDTEDALQGYLDFFNTHDMSHTTLEILPYHEYGKEKWQQCGMTYKIKDGFVTDKRIKQMETAFRKANVEVIHT